MFGASKHLAEAGALPAEIRSEVEAALAEAKQALESTDDARIGAARERLERAAHGMAQAMYARNGAANQSARPTEESVPDDVIDAEYEEKAS